MAILSTTIKIKWNHNTKNYYINKGYSFSNFGEYFDVLIKDLPLSSRYEIRVKCDICEAERFLEYQFYNKNIKNYNIYTCNNSKCSKIKNKKTCLLKYDDENYNNKEKYIKTSLEKYGVDNPSKTKEVFEKRTKTNIERFGCENVFQNEEIKNKIKNILLEKYTVTNALKNKELLNKSLQTLFNNYGVTNAMRSEEIKEKQKNTCIYRYGDLFYYITPRYNKMSLYFFELIERLTGLYIQHALKKEGEKRFKKYSVDGYIKDLNVIIEWDERYHKNENQKEKDIIRQKYLEIEFNCVIFRIEQTKDIKKIYSDVYNLCDKIMLLNKNICTTNNLYINKN